MSPYGNRVMYVPAESNSQIVNATAILIAMAHPKIISFGLYNRYDCFLYEQVRG